VTARLAQQESLALNMVFVMKTLESSVLMDTIVQLVLHILLNILVMLELTLMISLSLLKLNVLNVQSNLHAHLEQTLIQILSKNVQQVTIVQLVPRVLLNSHVQPVHTVLMIISWHPLNVYHVHLGNIV
jgi:hypothetical protein